MRSFQLLLTLLLGVALVATACAPPRTSPPAHPESALAEDPVIEAEDPREIDPEANVPIMQAEVDTTQAIRGEDDNGVEDDGNR